MSDFRQSSQDPPVRTELSGLLRESVEAVLREPIREDDVNQAMDRARQLTQVPAPRRSRRSRRLLVAAAIAATLAVAVLLLWPDWHPVASVAWADVVEAVSKKPWLHYVTAWPADGPGKEGTRKEGWYSASRAVEGSHYMPGGPGNGLEEYTWTDYAKDDRTHYFRQANTIVHGTEPKGHWEHYKFFWTALLSGDLGGTIREGRYEIVDQQQRVIVEEGKRCIEYRFRWRESDKEARSATQFVAFVDPDSRLPFRMDMVTPSDPKATVHERYDYPASGPEDIYALGVPKSAKIVDCSPPSDVEQLAKATVAAGCRDDIQFSALIVCSTENAHSVYRAWKKGLRWKIDASVGALTMPSDQLPSTEADLAAWWKQKTEKTQFAPKAIFDGKWHWEYSTKTRHPNQAEIDAGMNKNATMVVSTEKKRLLPWPRDYYWEEHPLDLMGHPTNFGDYSLSSGLPIYEIPYQATIELKPKHGPSRTVLLELRNPIWKRDDSKLPGQPQIIRFWIDPARDYLVMRWETVISQEGKEEMTEDFRIEGLTQDPRKRWFPTLVHRLVLYKGEKNLADVTLRFYYDFDSPIPDSTFEAH